MANCSAAAGGTAAGGTAAAASKGGAAAVLGSAPGTRAQPQRSPLPTAAAEGDGGGKSGGEGMEEAAVDMKDSGTAQGAAVAAATAATAIAAAAATPAAIATTATATPTTAAAAASEDGPPRHLYCASLLPAQRCFDQRGDWRLAWTDEADDKLAELLRRFQFDFASSADALATWVRIERKWAVRVGLLSARECRFRWVELDRLLAAHCEAAL